MSLYRFPRGGFGSGIALRTYLLFCVCALVPVGIFGAIGYGAVSAELRANARLRLVDASKHYGLLINDRLIQAETALVELARAHSANVAMSAFILDGDMRLRNVTVRELPKGPEGDADNAAPVATLHISDSVPATLWMQVTLRTGRRQIVAAAQLLPAELWDANAVTAAGMSLCVSAAGKQLSCISADEGAADPNDALLRERWTLFLKPRYGAEAWTIEARQPASIALAGLRTFQRTLLGAAGLAGFAALLLSAVLIRRSHRPLAELIEAARLMGARRFDTRVKLRGTDELGRLGRAFNRLAAGLQRQFRMLRAFSRIDRQILANPEVGPVIRSVLPRVRRLLHAQVAMVAVQEAGGMGVFIFICSNEQSGAIRAYRLADDLLDAMLKRSDPLWMLPAEHAAANACRWSSTSIVVGGALRGVVAVARGAEQPGRPEDARHLHGLARRFAVALNNEDRERALLRQAYYDSLTSLPNRQLFNDRLAQDILRADRGGRVVLLFIDLDHFKNVNDSLGHSAGDAVLCSVAERLQRLLRPGDTLARLGGDEFTLLAPGLDDPAAEALALRVLDTLGHSFDLSGRQYVVQGSIGIAVYPRDCATAEALVRNADTAMYRAKQQGRGKAVFFEETMNVRAVRRLALEQRLRLAPGNGSLSLVYQAKFAAADCSLAGAEALLRWNDPVEGHVSPDEFIPIAEDSGLIEPLGMWVIRTACATMRGWRTRGLDIDHVAVNVSMRQLRNPAFADLVSATLLEFGLAAADLQIEVTESMLAGDIRQVATLLATMRDRGILVAIDDFGTGYSSMVALQQLPADVVKIDRTFVDNCEQPEGFALLNALAAAGRALGRKIVAEGVETAAQLAIVRSCGCDVVQGYLLGRPRPADEFERSLSLIADVDSALA